MNAKNLLLFILLLFFIACKTEPQKEPLNQTSIPSHNFTYANVSANELSYLETDYVPIYSDIYHMDGTKRFLLTSTLSIRNNSQTDSACVFKADYHDSYGNLLRNYIDAAILLKPLESIEFVVEYEEDQGGAGASFIIEWGANIYSDQLLIQAIMTGTSNQQGLSFTTNAKKIGHTLR